MNAITEAFADQALQAPAPLPHELEPVDPLPFDALPQALRPWIGDVAERMQCPPDFVAVPMLIAAASLAARRVAICPQAHTDWTVTGNLWGLIVGRPGLMKSPAMDQALAFINRLEAAAADKHADAMRVYEAEKQAAKLRASVAEKCARKRLEKDPGANLADLLASDEPEAPSRPRYIVTDATYEKLGELLVSNPDGLLCVRDEMRSLLAHLSREEQASARGFWLQSWSGGRYVFDRIMRGTVTIPDVRISMVGCIQPGPLSGFVRSATHGGEADDGLIQRFLIAWPDDPGHWRNVDRWPDSQAKRQAFEVFEKLDQLDAGSLAAAQDTDFSGQAAGLPYLRFAPDALEAFTSWRGELEARLRSGASSQATEAALSKFRKHIPALALTMHLIDGGRGAVGLVPTLRALALADYFESHATRAYASGTRPVVKTAKAILRKLKTGALAGIFTAREVYRPGWEGLTDRELVEQALGMLVTHRYLIESEVPAGKHGGRPTWTYAVCNGALA